MSELIYKRVRIFGPLEQRRWDLIDRFLRDYPAFTSEYWPCDILDLQTNEIERPLVIQLTSRFTPLRCDSGA